MRTADCGKRWLFGLAFDGQHFVTVSTKKSIVLLDPETLRVALERLLGDEDLGRRFVEASLARRDTFTREGTFSEVEAVLKRLAGEA